MRTVVVDNQIYKDSFLSAFLDKCVKRLVISSGTSAVNKDGRPVLFLPSRTKSQKFINQTLFRYLGKWRLGALHVKFTSQVFVRFTGEKRSPLKKRDSWYNIKKLMLEWGEHMKKTFFYGLNTAISEYSVYSWPLHCIEYKWNDWQNG